MFESAAPPQLSSLERRVLGVLAEKAKTTPDAYPLSLNALVTGCNQKSNRDPLMDLDEGQVEETLEGLQKRHLVILVQSSRVDRWRHNLFEEWTSEKSELAVLTELLLRGPQTEGELRGRAARFEPIDDLDHLRSILKPLVEKKFVIYLTPERSRGAMLTHGFHAPEELENLARRTASQPVIEAPAPMQRPVPVHTASESTPYIENLSRELADLRLELDDLKKKFALLQQALGMNPS